MRTSVLLFTLATCALAQTPNITSVTNAFTGLEPSRVAPGLLVNIFGTNLGPANPVSAPTDPVVTVDGKRAYVVSASSRQILAQMPVDLPMGGNVFATVEYNGARSNIATLTVASLSPGVATTGTGASTVVGAITNEGTVVNTDNPAKPGARLSIFAVGLGATTPPMPLGPASSPSPVNNPVTVRIGGQQAQGVVAALAQNLPGTYQISFVVPQNVPGGFQPLVVEVAGSSSPSANMAVSPLVRAVVNSANFQPTPGIAPGTIVELFGGNFTTQSLTGFPATTIDGITVLVNDAPVPLFRVLRVDGGRVLFQMPHNARESGEALVQLRTPDGTSAPVRVTLTDVAPGIYLVGDPGNPTRPYAAATVAGTAHLAIPRAMATRLNLPTNCSDTNRAAYCGEPVRPGDNIQIFMTGLGRTTANGDPNGAVLATGDLAPANGIPFFHTAATPTVLIGGSPARVTFSGLTPGSSGLYQVNVVIPEIPDSDDVPVAVRMPNGVTATSRIAVR